MSEQDLILTRREDGIGYLTFQPPRKAERVQQRVDAGQHRRNG